MRRNNYKFLDSAKLNQATLIDYENRLRKVALSIFEWVNLPESMDSWFIEKTLYLYGQCAFLYDDKLGYIATKCTSSGGLNIYDLPTKLNCYSYNYQVTKKLYTGLNNNDDECILVMNNFDLLPTINTIQLFAYRLYEAERTTDVNIKAQKTPVVLVVDEKQRLMMENLYNQYNGNQPFIFGDKNQMEDKTLKAIKTDAPYLIDKIQDYKKSVWNEALTFLGINNIPEEKKERLVQDEVDSNNELINLNLQSYLEPRKKACEQFNKKFNFTNTNQAIDVKVRSDLKNIIKNADNIFTSNYSINKEVNNG